ncbi:hypothetical protein HMPREF1550_00726 [Actinomyces sp. oral taxon 877 str. F0543]|nr:hypothetical protein HMPREF1550_00726 [Actinomyces sp. oral taxon 877 str. F0543]
MIPLPSHRSPLRHESHSTCELRERQHYGENRRALSTLRARRRGLGDRCRRRGPGRGGAGARTARSPRGTPTTPRARWRGNGSRRRGPGRGDG